MTNQTLDELFQNLPAQAESKGLKRVSHKHEAIMLFMVANPTVRIQDVARHFEVTSPWLSTLIHSDTFKAKFRSLKDQYAGTVLLDVGEKLNVLAHMSLDKLIEELPDTKGIEAPRQVANDVLKNLGYGAPVSSAPGLHIHTKGPTQVNAGVLNRALDKRQAVINGVAINESTETEGVQAGAGSVTVDVDDASSVHEESSSEGSEACGDDIRGTVPPVGEGSVGESVQGRAVVELPGSGWPEAPVVPD